MNCRNKQWRNPSRNSMKKKLQDLLDEYSNILSLMEKRRDEDMARLYKIEVQLMNIVEFDLKKKQTKRKTTKKILTP
jgi:hypothetical protein